MLEGKLVKTGACKQTKTNPGGKGLEIGDGANSVNVSCANVEGDIFIKKHNFLPNGVRTLSPEGRLYEYNVIGNLNTTGLGAKDFKPPGAAFLQSKENSNDELPNYFNPSLTGKGFSFNSSPTKS